MRMFLFSSYKFPVVGHSQKGYVPDWCCGDIICITNANITLGLNWLYPTVALKLKKNQKLPSGVVFFFTDYNTTLRFYIALKQKKQKLPD